MTEESTMSSQTQSGKVWEIVKVLVPSVVTALAGFVIWNAQTNMQQTVDNSNELLKSQLALKEEFYKRRLTIYENTCKQIADTKAALNQAGASPDALTRAMATMNELDKLRSVNMLYWSPGLEKRLGNLWWLGIDKLRENKFEDDQFEEMLVKEIEDLHTQMKQDLQLK